LEKGEPSYTVGGIEAGATTLENSREVPQDAKNRVILRPSNWVFTPKIQI